MLGELLQVGRQDDWGIRAEGDMFRLPLSRGFSGTLATDHEEGLWLIVATPASPHDTLARDDPSGLSAADVAVRFPAMAAGDTSCRVSAAVAHWLDLGCILRAVKVVE